MSHVVGDHLPPRETAREAVGGARSVQDRFCHHAVSAPFRGVDLQRSGCCSIVTSSSKAPRVLPARQPVPGRRLTCHALGRGGRHQ